MRQNIIKLFALSWYIFLTYIYDPRSHLYQNVMEIVVMKVEKLIRACLEVMVMML